MFTNHQPLTLFRKEAAMKMLTRFALVAVLSALFISVFSAWELGDASRTETAL